MNTFTKRVLVGALAFGVIGTILMTTGYALGGKDTWSALASATHLSKSEKNNQYLEFGAPESDQAYRLQVNVSTGKAFINQGDIFSVETNRPDLLDAQLEHGTLSVALNEPDSMKWAWPFRWFGFYEEAPEVTITLPKDLVLEEAVLETNTGTTNINFLKTKHLELEINTGLCKLKTFEVEESTSIFVNTGTIQAKGVLGKRSAISVNTGTIDLTAQEVTDYGYSIQNSTGILSINDSPSVGLNQRVVENSDAEIFFDLSCKTGILKLKTES